MNDHIFQQLAASYPAHMVWEFNLKAMWEQVHEILENGS